MALASAIQWEVRPNTGTNVNNGGGFKAGAAGTDRSLQADAQVIIDNATITCTTPAAGSNTLTFTAGYTPTAADVGNVVAITAGTNINAGLYEITGQNGQAPPNGTWTVTGGTNLTTGVGAGSAILGRMGGARKGLASGATQLIQAAVSGNKIWIKAEPGWSEVIAANHSATAALPIVIEGYNGNRGDNPTGNSRPTNRLAGAGVPLTIQYDYYIIKNLVVGWSTTTYGFVGTKRQSLWNCRSTSNAGSGFFSSAGVGDNQVFAACQADGNGSHGWEFGSGADALLFGCVACGNNGSGIALTDNTHCVGCLSFGNGVHGISIGNAYAAPILQCTLDRNGSDGVNGGAGLGSFGAILNSILSNNVNYGVRLATQGTLNAMAADYNDFYANGTPRLVIAAGAHDLALDPQYVDNSVLSLTDLAIDAGDATKVTSAAHPFEAVDIGRYLRISAGTGFTVGGYAIVNVVGSTATLDYACGTLGSTGGTAKKYGTDFRIGTNLAGQAWPGQMPGGPVAYPDIGAVQRDPGVGAGTGGGPLVAGRLVG